MNNEELVLKNTVYASGFLYYLNRSHNSYLYHYMQDLNINGNEYSFLLYLYHNSGSTQQEIAENFKIPKSQVSRSFKTLEEKKLIIRKKDENNKKFYKLFLTEKAEIIIDKLSEIEYKWSNMIYSQIASDDKEARNILTEITVNALNFTDEKVNKDEK